MGVLERIVLAEGRLLRVGPLLEEGRRWPKAGRTSRPGDKLDWTWRLERGVRKETMFLASSLYRPVILQIAGASCLPPGLSVKLFSRTKIPSKPPITSGTHLVESMLKLMFLSRDIVDIWGWVIL